MSTDQAMPSTDPIAVVANAAAAPADTLLPYAPRPRAARTPVYVILWGLFSTAVALTALHFIQQHVEADIMSFTVRLIFPVGAMAVGFAAGLGYGIAAYLMHVRVRGGLIWLIVLLLVWAYFAGRFIEFKAMGPLFEKSTGRQVGFIRFYHLSTIYMTSMSSGPATFGARKGEELGYFGYFYRGLGILGFVLGGIIISLVQRTLPYCPLCQRYMKSTNLLTIPATGKLKAVRLKSSFKLDEPEHQAALERAMAAMKEMTGAISSGDAARVRELMATSKQKVPARVPLYAAVDLQYCRQCFQGTFSASFKNNNNYQTPLAGEVVKGDVAAEVVRPVVDPRAPVVAIPQASVAVENSPTLS